MAKDKSEQYDYKSTLERQRREAKAAIKRNRMKVGNKYRSLTKSERAAYQKVVARADEVLGPETKSGAGALSKGVSGLSSGLETLGAFAKRLLEGKRDLEDIADK